jgi:hypothetical protein
MSNTREVGSVYAIHAPTEAERYVSQGQVEWARIPDVDRMFGIRRSKLYELITSGAVVSSCIRRKGAKTGVRVVNVESVREFLRANASRF